MRSCEYPALSYETLLLPWEEHYWHEIPRFVWEQLQDDARERIERSRDSNIDTKLIAHWQSIVDGKPPFGLKVEK